MRARGFATTLGSALAGASIALATPAGAAPEGPDNIQKIVSDQGSQSDIVDIGQLGGTMLDRSKVLGVQPGLDYQRLAGGSIYLDVG